LEGRRSLRESTRFRNAQNDRKIYHLAIDYGSYYLKYGIDKAKPPIIIDIWSLNLGKCTSVSSKRNAPRHYFMKNSMIEKEDKWGWNIIERATEKILKDMRNRLSIKNDFNGFHVIFSIRFEAPLYMYKKFFDIFRKFSEINLVKAVTAVQQPVATAIAYRASNCVIVESGYGSTQILPITSRIIRGGIIPLNRGGGDMDALTREILKDAGYCDVAKNDLLVREVKERIGAIPIDLEKAIQWAKEHPEKVRARLKPHSKDIGGEIDLEEHSWRRFLIGEYVFNPKHEIFQSYHIRGFPRPKEALLGNKVCPGDMPLDEAIIKSIKACCPRIIAMLIKNGAIMLSGGNMAWRIPKGLEEAAATADQKISYLLLKKGLRIKVELAPDPLTSVWKGCLIYGQNLPLDMKWSWDTLDGWKRFGET